MDRGLRTLHVENFGLLGDVTVGPLGRVNVLVGPNGSGKSTVLNVIRFLGNAARLQLGTAIDSYGGFERILTRRKKRATWLTISIKAIVTQHAHDGALDEYKLDLFPVSPTEFIHEESFRFKRTARHGRRITLEGGKLHVADEGKKRTSRSLDKDAFGLAVLPQLGADTGGSEKGREDPQGERVRPR